MSVGRCGLGWKGLEAPTPLDWVNYERRKYTPVQVKGRMEQQNRVLDLTGNLIDVTVSDMNKRRRSYTSPLREAKSRETRERILASVESWMKRHPDEELTLEAIARDAKVERRTVLRHFNTKEALLGDFWDWINQRMLPQTYPPTLKELLEAPRETFVQFDHEEGLIRSSLHSRTGRVMRLGSVPERQKAFREVLGTVTDGVSEQERRQLEAVIHALYSAATWETMRDYADMSGAEAGEAVSWAINLLIEGVKASRTKGGRRERGVE